MTRSPVVPDGWRPYTPAQKARLVTEIVGTYLRVKVNLARDGLPATVARLRSDAGRPRRERNGQEEHLAGVRLGMVIARTLRVLPTDSRCLMQSLVLTSMLARRGTESSLVIGVRSDPAFAAHAWVERDDAPLLPTDGDRYQRLLEL